jgi:hypothetical protein
MSFDQVQLPASVLADLYPNTLIGNPAVAGSQTVNSPDPRLRFLGNNGKRITLILRAENAVFIPDHQLEFMTKILEACRINLADVAILNHRGNEISAARIKEELQPVILILFGIEPDRIGLPFSVPLFQIFSHDSCQVLHAPSLEQLNQEGDEGRLLKSKLWLCLRALFGL